MSLVAGVMAGASVASLAGDASACGGLFCSNANPVNQVAERIIFAQGDGSVTAAIEIQYEGPSHEFAWVLPVPDGDVEVGVSSKIAFDRIQAQSNPLYTLAASFESCDNASGVNGGYGVAVTNTSGMVGYGVGADGAPREAVTVEDSGNAGPYDYVVISVDDALDEPADAAVNWLEENGYDVADIGPETLTPYLEEGMNLIAFRLSKGQDSGSIRPVLITYEGDSPSIPILPTAVAADPDMGVLVWVLGSGRAIPSNYLHLELNEAVINWFNPTPTYNDVIVAAADEAGGHGFITEQSGAAGQFSEAAYASWEQDQWERLRTGSFGSILEFLQSAASMFGTYDGFTDLLRDPEVLPLREGATPEQFMACMSCYFETNVAVRNEAYPDTPYDAETDPLPAMNVLAFLDKMDELVITPLAATRALFDNNERATRLYTTLSPDEMTLDPVFDFNAELPDVNNLHTANQIFQCGGDAEWRVELPQGMTIYGDGANWPVSLDDDEFPVNFRVVQLTTQGEGEVVDSNASAIGVALTDLGVGEPGAGLLDAMDDEVTDSTSSDSGDSSDSTSTTDDGSSADDASSDSEQMDTADGTSSDPDGMGEAQSSSGGCQLSSGGSSGSASGALWLLGLVGALRRRRQTHS